MAVDHVKFNFFKKASRSVSFRANVFQTEAMSFLETLYTKPQNFGLPFSLTLHNLRFMIQHLKGNVTAVELRKNVCFADISNANYFSIVSKALK